MIICWILSKSDVPHAFTLKKNKQTLDILLNTPDLVVNLTWRNNFSMVYEVQMSNSGKRKETNVSQIGRKEGLMEMFHFLSFLIASTTSQEEIVI